MVSFRGQKSLGHAQIGLFRGLIQNLRRLRSPTDVIHKTEKTLNSTHTIVERDTVINKVWERGTSFRKK